MNKHNKICLLSSQPNCHIRKKNRRGMYLDLGKDIRNHKDLYYNYDKKGSEVGIGIHYFVLIVHGGTFEIRAYG